MGTPNKYIHGDSSINDRSQSDINIYVAKVLSVDDPFDGCRIKARIYGVDNKIDDNDPVLFAFPLLPKLLHVMPAVGETVLIFIRDSKRAQDDRFFIGPVISQPQFLANDQHTFTSRSLLKSGGLVSPDVAPSNVADAAGVYPLVDEIALQGRVNADVLLRDNQVVIRAGKFVLNSPLVFNQQNPAYFKVQSNTTINTTNNVVTKGTVASIVADRLLLLTHTGNKANIKNFKITDANVEISDSVIADILENAEHMVYGDLLVSFCQAVKAFALNHTHAYSGLPPLQEASQKALVKFDLDSLLAQNIRIV